MVLPIPKKKLRSKIRNKVLEILRGKTLAGSRVYPNASIPPWEDELPVILIYARSETISEYAKAPRELERNLDLAIEIIAKGPEINSDLGTPDPGKMSLEDQLDLIAEQVECELSRDDTLGCTADDSILTNTELEFDSSGGLPIGSARLTYSVTYFRMSPDDVDKQSGLSDFNKAEIDYNVSDDDNTREAHDSVDIPTV